MVKLTGKELLAINLNCILYQRASNHSLANSDQMRVVLDGEEDVFKRYCDQFPAKEVTNRGEKFFHRHPAKYLLAEDVKSGLAYELKPELLHAHRSQYQEFPLRTFRKYIHQEKEKQRTEPYWRHKRNIQAMFQLVKQHGLNKQEWINTRVQAKVDLATSVFAQIGRLE